MARKRNLSKNLGIALIIGLLIQFVLPQVRLGNLAWISTIIYLVVAIMLLIS